MVYYINVPVSAGGPARAGPLRGRGGPEAPREQRGAEPGAGRGDAEAQPFRSSGGTTDSDIHKVGIQWCSIISSAPLNGARLYTAHH